MLLLSPDPIYFELTKEKIKEIEKALTLSPESKKALLDGTDKVSTLTGMYGAYLIESGVGVEVGIILMGISFASKGIVYYANDRDNTLDTLELIRDNSIDTLLSPAGVYGVFGAEFIKAAVNAYVPIK